MSVSVATAAAGAKAAADGVQTLSELWSQLLDRQTNSLTAFTKKTLISSRVYIEDGIAAEPIIPNLMKLANRMYAGMVFAALGLSQAISGGKTVRDMLSPVATENFMKISDLIAQNFGDLVPGNEALENKDEDDKKTPKEKSDDAKRACAEINEKNIKVDAADLFCGKLLEITLGRGDNAVKVPFFVQLFPYILPKIVLEEFMSNHIDPPKALRKAAWKAGEISFWKDFVFECDRVQKRKKALIADKAGILREIEDIRAGQFGKSLRNFLVAKGSVNRNAASSIVIIRKATLDKLCRDFGINMKNMADRQRIFSNIFGMMIFAYDPDYNTIDLYMNGINARGEYTAAMVQSATKKDDALDLKTLLTIMAAGGAPKF